MKSHLLGAVCGGLLSVSVSPAIGSVVYSYTGNTFDIFSSPTSYTTSMAVTGAIELAAPLGTNLSLTDVSPVSFSLNDGINTISDTNASSASFKFSTDSTGLITNWSISLTQEFPSPTNIGDTKWIIDTFKNQDGGFILTCNSLQGAPANCNGADQDFGSNQFKTGSWIVSAVPVPAAVWLFGSGLLGLIGIVRKKAA